MLAAANFCGRLVNGEMMITSRPGAMVTLTVLTFLLVGSALGLRARIPTELKSGDVVHNSIKGGESQVFRVAVRKGQFLEIEFSSSTLPVSVALPTPRGDLHPSNSIFHVPAKGVIRYVADETESQVISVYCTGRTGREGDYSLRFSIIDAPSNYQLRYARLQWTFETLWAAYYKKAYDDVIERGERALAEWRELQDAEYIGKTCYQLGEAYHARERFPEAMRAFNEALPYYINENIPHYQAIIYTSLGQIHGFQGDYRKAIELYEKALPLWTATVWNPAINMLGWNLLNLGQAYRAYGDWTKAAEYFEEARKCYRDNDAVKGQKEGLFGQGVVESSLGSISQAKGDKQAALDHLKQAVDFFKLAKDEENEFSTYGRLGEVYSSLGDYDQAHLYFDRSLEFYSGKDSLAEATVLNAYGNLLRREGQYDFSLTRLNRSLAIRQKLGDRRGQALALTALGASNVGQHQVPQALENYREAQDLWKDIGDRYNQATTLNYLGLALLESKELSGARTALLQALQLRRQTFDREGEADTLYQLARLDFNTGALSAAREKIVAAIGLSEAVRASVNGDELRAHYLASVRDYYEFYLDVLMRLQQLEPKSEHAADAFRVGEMARARSLLETLSGMRFDLRSQTDSKLQDKEIALQTSLNAKAEYVRNLRLKKAQPALIDAGEKTITDLIEQIQFVRGQIRAANPRFAELTQTQPADIKRIQKGLLDKDTILLSYSLGKERSYLWLVSDNTVSVHVLPSRQEIEGLATRVYGLLSQKQVQEAGQSSSSAFDRESRRLANVILGPVAGKLHRERLLIIADGALQYIPFGMLPVSRSEAGVDESCGPYLINDHEIVNAPSASALLTLRERAVPAPGKQIAVIADPVFDRNDFRVKAGARSVASLMKFSGGLTDALRDVGEPALPRLIRTRDEARAISQYAPQGDGNIQLDFSARRESLTERDLSQFRIIHIATHGLLDAKHPELSGLVFSMVDESGVAKDGFLRLHEIYNLKLNADLVVLSACQTGLGKEIRGEGLVGLTRGFMYAGARRVVASLWKVDDSATAEMMKLFYEEMLGSHKASPAAALRAAQLKLMQQRRWSSPNAWAAFVLQGEWN